MFLMKVKLFRLKKEGSAYLSGKKFVLSVQSVGNLVNAFGEAMKI